MKKIIFLLLLIAIPVALIAQEIPAPQSWGDIILNFNTWFASFGGIVVLTTFLAAFFNGIMNVQKKFVKQLIAWIVAIALLIGSDLANWGYAKEMPLLLAAIHGLAAGLAANGIFDIPFMKSVLDAIQGWFTPKAK